MSTGDLRFAVVDLETTGGPPGLESITEIAVVFIDGGAITGTWDSLIDPGNPISPFVQRLTGITDAMVRGQPSFANVAEDLAPLLEGRVLVAHNIAFDYSYLRQAFLRTKIEFAPPRLCTIRLARRAFPGLPSYGLGNLGKHLPMPSWSHHRALGDAQASAWLLQQAMERLPEQEFLREIKGVPIAAKLLPGWTLERLGKLPSQTGILWVHGRQGQVLYVCTAPDLHARALALLGGSTKRSPLYSVKDGVESFSWQVTDSQVLAHLLLVHELTLRCPPCNKTLRIPCSTGPDLSTVVLAERLGSALTLFYVERGQFCGYVQLSAEDAFPFPQWKESLQKVCDGQAHLALQLRVWLQRPGQKTLRAVPL